MLKRKLKERLSYKQKLQKDLQKDPGNPWLNGSYDHNKKKITEIVTEIREAYCNDSNY